MDFIQFIAGEEQNMLTSMVNLRADLDVFSALDNLWLAPIDLIDVPEKEKVIPMLYLFTHFQMYVSVAAMMRAHLSESMGSTRKAVDAALSAYEMILDPASIPMYEAGHNRFRFIKGYITDARKKDNSRYPLAEGLLAQHETFSEYGSHADASSFVYRLEENIDIGKKNKSRSQFKYFQFPKKRSEFHLHFLELLVAYYGMLEIFRPMILKYAKGLDKAWEVELGKLKAHLESEIGKAKAHFDKQEEGPAATYQRAQHTS